MGNISIKYFAFSVLSKEEIIYYVEKVNTDWLKNEVRFLTKKSEHTQTSHVKFLKVLCQPPISVKCNFKKNCFYIIERSC